MSHEHLHELESNPVTNPYAKQEISRREMIARTLGIGATLLLPSYLSACGNQKVITTSGDSVPLTTPPEGLQRIDESAIVSNGAVRVSPPETIEYPVLLINPGSHVVDGDPTLPLVSYSIDDVPGVRVSRDMMNACDNEGLPGVLGFFGVGVLLNANIEVSHEMVERGFMIHNHSWTHQYGIQTNINEIDAMQSLLMQLNGRENKIFRNPGGYVNQSLLDFLASRGMFYLWTSVDLGDWKLPRPSVSTLLERHNAVLAPGRHFLLHGSDSHSTTTQALPLMFREANARGLTVVSPEEHMAAGNPTQRAYRLIETQEQITETYATDGRFEGVPELEANWIVTLETSLEESAHLTPEGKDLLESELKTRKQLLGID